jgi:peptidoglycan/LPS O-acetylase OafA/YrhL
VGVDVFFVISGFLISLLLFKELSRTGRISLSGFYARRVRRLIPAALATTIVTLMVSVFVFGPLQLISVLRDAAWTAIYLANAHFAGQPGGYFATTDPSPFLHFWSLAVEEQYYLIWPLAMLLAFLLFRHRPAALGWLLLAVFAISLTLSIVWTNAESPQAYFSLATRAWELAIGGIVAWIAHYRQIHLSVTSRTVASIAGLALIAAAACSFSESTPFPGWTALIPTIGAALLIVGGTAGSNSVGAFLSVRPVRFVGDISYSLYLWHWPVLMLSVAVFGPLGWKQAAVCVLLAFALAVLSYYFIERPTSRWRITLPTRRVVLVGVAVAVVAALVPASVSVSIPTSGGQAVAAPSGQAPIAAAHGSPPTLPPVGAPPEAVPANLTPSLDKIPTDIPVLSFNGCMADVPTAVVCEGGDPAGTKRIALVGDSHAAQWWPAVDRAGRENGWKVYFIGKNSCPVAVLAVSRDDTSDPWPLCSEWQENAIAKIVGLKADLVIWAANAYFYNEYKKVPGPDFDTVWPDAVRKALRPISAVSRVLYIGQVPYYPHQPAACLAENLTKVAACSLPVNTAVPPKIRGMSASLAAEFHATYFDPATVLCTDSCALLDHNLAIYRDRTHISVTYADYLTPTMTAEIKYALT